MLKAMLILLVAIVFFDSCLGMGSPPKIDPNTTCTLKLKMPGSYPTNYPRTFTCTDDNMGTKKCANYIKTNLFQNLPNGTVSAASTPEDAAKWVTGDLICLTRDLVDTTMTDAQKVTKLKNYFKNVCKLYKVQKMCNTAFETHSNTSCNTAFRGKVAMMMKRAKQNNMLMCLADMCNGAATIPLMDIKPNVTALLDAFNYSACSSAGKKTKIIKEFQMVDERRRQSFDDTVATSLRTFNVSTTQSGLNTTQKIQKNKAEKLCKKFQYTTVGLTNILKFNKPAQCSDKTIQIMSFLAGIQKPPACGSCRSILARISRPSPPTNTSNRCTVSSVGPNAQISVGSNEAKVCKADETNVTSVTLLKSRSLEVTGELRPVSNNSGIQGYWIQSLTVTIVNSEGDTVGTYMLANGSSVVPTAATNGKANFTMATDKVDIKIRAQTKKSDMDSGTSLASIEAKDENLFIIVGNYRSSRNNNFKSIVVNGNCDYLQNGASGDLVSGCMVERDVSRFTRTKKFNTPKGAPSGNSGNSSTSLGPGQAPAPGFGMLLSAIGKAATTTDVCSSDTSTTEGEFLATITGDTGACLAVRDSQLSYNIASDQGSANSTSVDPNASTSTTSPSSASTPIVSGLLMTMAAGLSLALHRIA